MILIRCFVQMNKNKIQGILIIGALLFAMGFTQSLNPMIQTLEPTQIETPPELKPEIKLKPSVATQIYTGDTLRWIWKLERSPLHFDSMMTQCDASRIPVVIGFSKSEIGSFACIYHNPEIIQARVCVRQNGKKPLCATQNLEIQNPPIPTAKEIPKYKNRSLLQLYTEIPDTLKALLIQTPGDTLANGAIKPQVERHWDLIGDNEPNFTSNLTDSLTIRLKKTGYKVFKSSYKSGNQQSGETLLEIEVVP
jgi:hypothetical protein